MLDNMSPADLAAVMGGENGMNGGGVWLWFLLILLLFSGGDFMNGKAASTEDVQNQFNFAALERQNNEIIEAIKSTGYDVTTNVKDVAYNNLNQIRDIESMVSQNGYNTSTGFCGVNRNIDSLNANLIQQTAAINYNLAEQANGIIKAGCENTQKILDAISRDRMADMQNQINQLQIANVVNQATAGVVKYPSATTYNAGYNPYCSNNCSCS